MTKNYHEAVGFYQTYELNVDFVERVREDVQKRVNIVFGISPWFDWNEEDQSWESNQYYGEVHPIDMLHEGFLVDFK